MKNIKTASLTPHFRNLLREENPTWEAWEIMHWKWEHNTPTFRGEPLDIKAMDSRYPGGSAIGRMYADIARGEYRLTHSGTKFHF